MQETARQLLRWDDARLLLAARRCPSVTEAARLLAVDNTTLTRRMAALEENFGLVLFVRSRGRLTLTPLGQALSGHAESMERAAAALSLEAAAGQAVPAGEVRLSAPPTFARAVLAPALPLLSAGHPQITLVLTAEPRNVRLERWESDLAVRLSLPKSGGEELRVRRLGSMGYAPYCAETGRAETGRAKTGRAGRGTPETRWIAWGREFSRIPEGRWVEEQLGGAAPVLRSNDPEVMLTAAAAGAGTAFLPCALGERRAGLERAGPVALRREVWLLQRRDVGRAAHVRAVTRWIEQACRGALED